MARTVLTSQLLSSAGLTPTTVTPDVSGVQFRNTKRCFLYVLNGSGASITVTPKIGRQVEGISVVSPPRTLAAGAAAYYGPFIDDDEQPGLHDQVFVDFSAITTVTVALMECPLVP